MKSAGATIAVLVTNLVTLAPALADEPTYETVVTGTRGETPLADAPVATEVVTRAEIEASGADDLAELLEDRAGIDITRGIFGAGIELSGLPSEYTLILVDGQRVIGRTAGVVDLTRVPLDNVERVEIVRGPMSVLYGADAIGGVVNVITRNTKKPIEAEAHASFGSYGTTSTGARVGVAEGPWSTSLSASWLLGDGWDLRPETPATTASAWDEKQVAWKGGYKQSSKLRVASTADYMWRRMEGVDQSQSSNAIYDRINQTESANLVLLPRWKPDAPTIVESSVHFGYFRDQFVSDQRNSSDEDKDEETKEYLIEGSLLFQRAMGRHFASVGVEAANEHLETVRISEPGDRNRLAVFAQDEWYVSKEPRLVLLPALRFDTDSQFGEHVTPRLAARWDVVDGLIVRTSVGKAYRAPGFKELYMDFENPGVGYKVIGNTELGTEDSLNYGAGVELKPASWLWLGIDGQYIDLEDMISVVSLDMPFPAACGDVELCFTYDNLESSKVLGVDARARLVGKDVSLDLAATHTWSRDESLGGPIEGRPTWRTSAALSWMAPGRIEVDARVAFTDARPYYGDDGLGNLVVLRSEELTMVDARLSRRFLDNHLTVFVGVENAADDNDRYQAVPPRTFTAGASGRY